MTPKIVLKCKFGSLLKWSLKLTEMIFFTGTGICSLELFYLRWQRDFIKSLNPIMFGKKWNLLLNPLEYWVVFNTLEIYSWRKCDFRMKFGKQFMWNFISINMENMLMWFEFLHILKHDSMVEKRLFLNDTICW